MAVRMQPTPSQLGLQLERWRWSVCLVQEPKNIKALYRRAQGHMGSYDFQDAAKDCKKIMELEPENKAGIPLPPKKKYIKTHMAIRRARTGGGSPSAENKKGRAPKTGRRKLHAAG